MDRQQALNLLQLQPDADKETVIRRYNTIFKKYRDKPVDEKGVPLSQYEAAYNFLLGITYLDPQEALRKQKQQARPNRLLKWLKIDPDKARNLIYYYKWNAVILVLAVVLISWIVYAQVNRVYPDLNVMTVGVIVMNNQDLMEQSIKKEVPTVTEVQLQQLLLGTEENDRQMQMAMEQKLQLELIAGLNDLVIMDLKYYRLLASLGYFSSLDDRLQEFNTTAQAQSNFVIELIDNGVPTGEKHIYGINVTDSRFLKDNELIANGETIVAALPVNREYLVNADALMKVLMRK